MDIKRQLEEQLTNVVGETVKLGHPEVAEFGDFSSNLALTKKGGRPLAESWLEKIKEVDLVKSVEVAGPGFINISIQTRALIKELYRVIKEGKSYGSGEIGKGKVVVIDYSAPNIAKRFGIGHLRSTIIGQALYNLYKFLGYETIGDNHLGDWGTQFGKLLYMIDKNQGEEFDIDKLEQWYVEFHQHPEWEEEGRKWFKKLEEKDPVAIARWQACVDISMKEFDRIYDLLGVHIDYAYGEAFYGDLMPEVIREAKEKKLATESEGALVIEIPTSKTPLMLLKSDGATTYATRDLATLKYRQEKWNPDVLIYEVGNEQALHFQQVFAAGKMLGYLKDGAQTIHTRHGLYLNPDGKKFSTRKGDTVKLDEVLGEAIERASKMGDGEVEVAKQVGIGAIKYFDLSHSVQSDIVFDWDQIMALEGNSGPYLQYTYARIKSVLRKSGEDSVPENEVGEGVEKELTKDDMALIRYIYQFGEMVEEAANRYAPNLLTNYLYELASRYNTFYNQQPILNAANVELKNLRLVLSMATGQVLQNGLRLLGIETPERM